MNTIKPDLLDTAKEIKKFDGEAIVNNYSTNFQIEFRVGEEKFWITLQKVN